jgi:hypothetical protein
MNLLIGTPAYGGMVHLNYLNSIIDFSARKIPLSVMCIGNESLICRGRNTIISYFYHNPQFTHLIFIDADIALSGSDLIKMLASDKDVLGAPVALKGSDKNGNKVYNIGRALSAPNGQFTEVDRVGTGVLLLSRNVVEALVKKAIDNNDVYNSNPNTRIIGGNNISDMYDIFKTGISDGTYLSEDFYLCDAARSLGYNIYIDESIQTKHAGVVEF